MLVDAGKAMAAWQETLVSGRTPFDEYRDALARGDADTARRKLLEAQRPFVDRALAALLARA